MEPFSRPVVSVKHSVPWTTTIVDTATVSSEGGGGTDDSLLSFATPSDAASSPSVVSTRGGGASVSVAFWEQTTRLSASDAPPVQLSTANIASSNFEDTGVNPRVDVAPSLAVVVPYDPVVVGDDSFLAAAGSSRTTATSASPDSQRADEDPQLYLYNGNDVAVDDEGDNAHVHDTYDTPDLERMIEETMRMVHESNPPS